jgi:hypothetical protein
VQDKVNAGVFVPPPCFPGAHLLYAEVQGLNDRVKAELNANDVIERLLQIFKGQVRGILKRCTAPGDLQDASLVW